MTTSPFAGEFGGKMAFKSAQPNGARFYLAPFALPDGSEGFLYYPGMNATTITEDATWVLYLFEDGYYRIQSNDRSHWLAYDAHSGIVGFHETDSQAALFSLEGDPLGSQIFVKAGGSKKQVYYAIDDDDANVIHGLGTTSGSRRYGAFEPAPVTPSLRQIRQDKNKKAPTDFDFTNVTLKGQDLRGLNFTGAKFMNAQLAGAKLDGAILNGANFSQTNLRGLIWGAPKSATGMDLTRAVLGGCEFGDPQGGAGGSTNKPDFSNAVFSSADLTGAKLHYLNLAKAHFPGATLSGAVFDHCVLTSAQLDGAVALEAQFLNADLSDASAQGSDFTRAVFDKSDLTRVRMGSSSYLFDLDAKYAGDLDTHQFPRPALVMEFQGQGINLTSNAPCDIIERGRRWLIRDASGPYKLLLKERKIGGAAAKQVIQVFNVNPSLIPASLIHASCQGVRASGASLAGADLRGVRWYGETATFENADLEEAVFTGALLVETKFTQAHLSGADFADSILIQSHLDGCVAGPGASKRPISFEGAHLEGAKFDKASFSGAILTNALVALGSGVPLFVLPKEDRQYLTAAGLSHLSSSFKKAGFDLGGKPTVADLCSWNIDNSQSKPLAHKLYVVKIKANNSGFKVFSQDKPLFDLASNQLGLLNRPTATATLSALFRNNGYNLAPDAPITRERAWIISASDDATYLRSYRFIELTVKSDGDALTVYGSQPVLIDKLSEYPKIHFDPTTNLESAFSSNSIGPAGVPFSWITQSPRKIEIERFWTATVVGPGDSG
jgi:uncharacterized protein YjbI with pentapeptide repeats